MRKHARELLDRDKKKDELDLSFEVEKSSFVHFRRKGSTPHMRKSRVT